MLRDLGKVLGRGALSLVSQMKAGGVIINEHTLSAEQLRLHVDTLSRWFDFIHPDELPKRLFRRARRPFCLLTFDDGHLSNATMAAPELTRLGVPASFLVVTDFLGTNGVLWFTLYTRLREKLKVLPAGLTARAIKQLPYDTLVARLERACREHGISLEPSDEHNAAMSWDQARALRRAGFGVGAHGATHAIMTRETREGALDNIARGIARVSAELGEPCTSFAFPNGNYTAELAQHAQRCGARLVFTADPTWTDRTFPLWRLPRVQLFPEQDRATIELKIAASAAGRFIPSGDGNGLLYREINRLARVRAPHHSV